ncbi:Inosose dehydratase [Posidoniimonas polymericola]|uniref:Inosose dehydratase n=1 Tax=Posidoniimonas polymericola TaxID=2528002 RepID=A0A5C5XWD8_9BACT|nr:sugar phosphate isomerase/epimerase family protein [Posidoniimonas polymericola]TWT67646.1 Inosose dehydratase [Posidoniimonas polymericola]
MQLGFVSAILNDLNFDDVLATAAREGFDCVEVMCWQPDGPDKKFGSVTHLDLTALTQARADDILARCAQHGVAISALGFYSVPLSADREQAEAAVAHLHTLIDAAPLLRQSTINSFVGANHLLSMDDNLRLFAKVWPDIVRHAEDRGVRIGIENCPVLNRNTWPFGVNLAHSPAVWRRMFDVIPSASFGLNYDPSHMVMQLMDPIGPIAEFADRIFHAHAKDMQIDRERLNQVGSLAPPMQRSAAKIPGRGEIDWRAFVAALRAAGFHGALCVECEDHDYEGPLEQRLEGLRMGQNCLRPLLGETQLGS